MALADRIRKARESTVEVGGYRFTIRRPTDLEYFQLAGEGPGERILPFVIGWDGVKEMDLIPGGDPHPLAFDAEACREWLSDRPDLFAAIAEGIGAAYRAHVERLEQTQKN